MKGFRGFVITLGVVLATMIFPSCGSDDPQTMTQQPATAQQAASANDRDTMESFVLNAKQHIDDIVQTTPSALSTLYRDMRDEGIWNHGSVYLIALLDDGTVANHGKYTKSLFGASLDDFPTVKRLLEGVRQDPQGEPVCEEYDREGSMMWSCAVGYTNAFGGRNVLIGGFDHEEEDMNVIHPDCPEDVPAVTAQQLSESQSKKDLETFVKEAIKQSTANLREGGQQGAFKSQIGCLGRGHWKQDSIYLFVMTAGTPPVVFFNGNNPELTGAPFVDVFDEDGVNVGEIIIEAAGEHEKGGFVDYKWDNPVRDGDEVSEPNMSPGTSDKTSYVEGVEIPLFGRDVLLIFGSGIYP